MIAEITNTTTVRIPAKKILQWIKFFEKKMAKTRGPQTLTLVFVTSQRIRSLNKKFRGKDKPTDVLSFAGTYRGHLGDLVLCPQVIKKQAKEHSLTFNQELAYMILHGILHLLGYEHEDSAKKAKIMFALQDKIFESLSHRF